MRQTLWKSCSKLWDFSTSGTHIAKKLALLTQGDILHRPEPGNHRLCQAAPLRCMGQTVCDIGISVDAAAKTVDRAQHLGADPFNQPIGPGELDIPAIRGLSGSVLHFIDQTSGLNDCLVRRIHQDGNPRTGRWPQRIDHLAQTMSNDEMLSWSLSYTSLFNMHKSPMVDVVDPDGLVRSQALETPDGAFSDHIEWGLKPIARWRATSLADSFGASVQHIAFGERRYLCLQHGHG